MQTNKILDLFTLLRPHQWIKNIFLFAPLFFSFAYTFDYFFNVLVGFMLFSFLASSIYIFNDYCDIEEDRQHPTKKNRPLAKGSITKQQAIVLMLFLSSLTFIASAFISLEFMSILVIYATLNLLYSIRLKHIAILDISIIAIGFVLRIFAGAVLIDKPVSMWIILVTFLLALFLALAKRRDDVLLNQKGTKTRKNIDGYNLEMINASMTLMATSTVVSYIMYTVSPEVIAKTGTHNLYLSAIFVIIGVLRYFQLTFVEQNSASPTKLLLKDTFLQFIVLAWIISFYIIARIL